MLEQPRARDVPLARVAGEPALPVYSSGVRTSRIVRVWSPSRSSSSCQVGTASGLRLERGLRLLELDRALLDLARPGGEPACEDRDARVARERGRLGRGRGSDAVSAVVEDEPLARRRRRGGPAAAAPRPRTPGPSRGRRAEEASRGRAGPSPADARAGARSARGSRRAAGRARPGAPAPRLRLRAAEDQTSARNSSSTRSNSCGLLEGSAGGRTLRTCAGSRSGPHRPAPRPPLRSGTGRARRAPTSTFASVSRTSSVESGRSRIAADAGRELRPDPARARCARACATTSSSASAGNSAGRCFSHSASTPCSLDQFDRLLAGLLALGRVRVRARSDQHERLDVRVGEEPSCAQ